LDNIVTKKSLDTIIAVDAIVVFVIPFIAMLTSSPVMKHKKHLWNFGVLQRVHFSNFISSSIHSHCVDGNGGQRSSDFSVRLKRNLHLITSFLFVVILVFVSGKVSIQHKNKISSLKM
jgi:hypothetical protein